EKDLFYSLVLARTGWASRTKWDLGFGTNSGLLFRFAPQHSAKLEARGEYDFFKSFEQNWFWTFSYSHAYTLSQRFEIRGNFDFIPRKLEAEKSAGLKGIYFF
ncbi:MAG: DUF7840 domain-containing protein, partial [Bdellovibrionota bacterium]